MTSLIKGILPTLIIALLLLSCSGPQNQTRSATATDEGSAEQTESLTNQHPGAPYTLSSGTCQLSSPELLSEAGPGPVSQPIGEADLVGARLFATFGNDQGLILWAGPTTSREQGSTWALVVDPTGPSPGEPSRIDDKAIRQAHIRPTGDGFLAITSRFEDGDGPDGSLWKNEALLISANGNVEHRIPLSRTAIPRGLSDVVNGSAYLLEADAGDPWSVAARRIDIDNGVLSQSLVMDKTIMSSQNAGESVRQGEDWWAFNDAEFVWLNGDKLPMDVPSTRNLDLGVDGERLLVMGLDENSGEPVLFTLNADGELLNEERRSPGEMPRGLEPGIAYTAAPASEATFLEGDPAERSAVPESSNEGTHVLVGQDSGWHQPQNGSEENTWFGWTSEGFAFIYTSPDQSRLYLQLLECSPPLTASTANAD